MSLRLTRKKRKAEDENEDEDDGCRRGRASAADRRLFRAEHAEGSEAEKKPVS